MNELVVLGILILIFIRIIGLIVSVDFYYDTKSKTYIIFIIGWSLWIISGIFPLLYQLENNQSQKEFFLLMNYIFGPLSLLVLLTGLSSFYLKISQSKLMYFSLILIITPLIVYFTLGLIFVSIFSRIIFFFSFLILFLLPNFKFKSFKEKIGKSIRWYYLICVSIAIYIPITISLLINNEFFGVHTIENNQVITISYVSIIITTSFIIAFIIHLEYNITYEQMKDLKDKYSHNLGNILQAIESAHSLTRLDDTLDNNSLLEVENIIEKKFREASKTLKEIRKL